MKNKKETNFGVFILGTILAVFVLQIFLLILKWTGNLSWSWWLVLIPAWIYLGTCTILFVIGIILVIWTVQKRH